MSEAEVQHVGPAEILERDEPLAVGRDQLGRLDLSGGAVDLGRCIELGVGDVQLGQAASAHQDA
jgi:hypothetical protein